MRVAVLGASGFVGSAIADECTRRGYQVRRVTGPRWSSHARSVEEVVSEAEALLAVNPSIADELRGVDVVINAAGLADALSGNVGALRGANALLPAVLALAAGRAQAARFIHVSSAAVQGRVEVLDESSRSQPFSPYSESKAWGESAVMASGTPSVIYRPTSVHGPSREMTRRLAHLAAGRFASVAGDGSRPSPQILVASAASAVAHLAGCTSPPKIVMHPWEGLTTASILSLLSGRPPRRIPAPVARAAVQTLMMAGGAHGAMAGAGRRLEMLWFGQEQGTSWLTTDGWHPPTGISHWQELGRAIRCSPTRNP